MESLGFEGTIVGDDGGGVVETVDVDVPKHALTVIDWLCNAGVDFAAL